jgi:hypothetical protein
VNDEMQELTTSEISLMERVEEWLFGAKDQYESHVDDEGQCEE